MRPVIFKCILFLALSISGSAFAQTFNVLSRNPAPGNAWLNLDGSIQVTFSVEASGLSEAVIPKLVPLGPFADSVSATWTGTSPTTNLSQLTFNIHLFNDPGLCQGQVAFSLLFFGEGFSQPIEATAASSLLSLDVRGEETTLTHLLSQTSSELPWPLSGSSASTHFLSHSPVAGSIINNPANRIYFWSDYNLNGFPWTQQFSFFLYSLGTSGNCTLGATSDLNFNQLISEPVVDVTGGTPVSVELAPPGGSGTSRTLGQGVNIYDVTDINPTDNDCGNSVRGSINYGSGISTLLWSYGGFSAVVRRFALYVGQPGCGVLQTNFGLPPGAGFHIDQMSFSSAGEVHATLMVPSAWKSGAQLGNSFRLQWYLRKDGVMIPLGGETRGLDLQADVGVQIDQPESFYLEARIRRLDTGAVVSLDNRGSHNRAYMLDDISFVHGEFGMPDAYLDPGEEMTLHYRVTHATGGTLSPLTYGAGLVIDSDGDGILNPSVDWFPPLNQPIVGGVNLHVGDVSESGAGSVRDVTVPFGLLTLDSPVSVWFYIDVSGENGVTDLTYRRYFSLRDLLGGERDLDGELTSLFYDFDFESGSHTTSGWLTQNDSSGPGSGGWFWDPDSFGPWHGIGGINPQNAGDLYSLLSPIWGLGRESAFSFTHQTGFVSGKSAGLLEYRTRASGESWGEWRGYLDDHCPSCGLGDGQFPGSRDSYFDGKRVWMNQDASQELVQLDIPASVGAAFPGEKGEIQFRMVYGDPSLADISVQAEPPTWDVSSFSYETQRFLQDNLFGINTDVFPLTGCEDLELTFTSWAPLPVGELTFTWYATLDDLWDDNGTAPVVGAAGLVVPFVEDEGLFTYYVRISSGDTERILPVLVSETIGISQNQAVLQIRQSASALWPLTESILPYVGIVNTVCPK